MSKLSIEDLRVGSTISIGDKVQKLTLKALCAAGKTLKGIQPVPITPELLIEAGFRFVPNKSNSIIYYRRGFHIAKSKDTWVLETEFVLYPQYMHEIENLLHACGEEDK